MTPDEITAQRILGNLTAEQEAQARAVADAERLVAMALLTPDALPDVLCRWCERPDCSDQFEHTRLDAESETTWRRRANEPSLVWWRWDRR